MDPAILFERSKLTTCLPISHCPVRHTFFCLCRTVGSAPGHKAFPGDTTPDDADLEKGAGCFSIRICVALPTVIKCRNDTGLVESSLNGNA